MLKFAGSNSETGRPVLGIGLSPENCTRLLAGEAITFTTEGMGLPDIQVFIASEEEALTNDMILTVTDEAIRPADKEPS